MLQANDPEPAEIKENPNFYYYNLPLRDGSARLVFTRDNAEGLLLTDDFRFASDRICLDHEETVGPEETEFFEFYRDLSLKTECSLKINKYLNNMQFIRRKKFYLLMK